MGRSSETFGKREKEKKRLKKQQEKAEKMEERKANEKKGKSLEDMMAYIDEDGNISNQPPDPRKKKVFSQEEIQIGVPKHEESEEDAIRTGGITFFNEAKGFGFIRDAVTGESIFLHVNNLNERVSEGDTVTFEVGSGPKGPVALNVSLHKK